MPKLNLSEFLNDLDKLPSTHRLLDNLGEFYLLKNVLVPLMEDQAVSLHNLDFDAFDSDDIYILTMRCEDADDNCSSHPLCKYAINTDPAVQSDCDFI